MLLHLSMLLSGFAVVKLATEKSSGEEFAVKIMALPEANAKAGDNENTRWVDADPVRCMLQLF